MKTRLFPTIVTFLLAIISSQSRSHAEPADCCDSQKCVCSATGTGFFGELLYMRPRNANVTYAVPMDGPIGAGSVPIQIGRMGVVNPEYEPGFRVGFKLGMDNWTNVGATYTHFESSTFDRITAAQLPPTAVVRSLVLHPSSANATADFSEASAVGDISFDLVDFDYRRVFSQGPRHSVNYLIGLRYARLEQDFTADFLNGGTETVRTDVSFDGGGIRLGLEAERTAGNSGLMFYGRGMASFVAGEFRGEYFQGSTADPVIVDTSWKSGRVVSILDVELGVGWVSRSGRFRVTGGYLFSSWLNTVQTDDLIGAVQTNSFVGLADGGSFGTGLTFDGFALRAELLW